MSWKGPAVVIVALVTIIVTVLILTGMTPLVPRHEVVIGVLLINLAIVVVLMVMVAREILGLRRARRRGRAASRLHERIVRLFAIVASVPVLMIAVIASVTLDRGLDSLFSGNVEAAINASREIGNTYVGEQLGTLRAEAGGVVQDLEKSRQFLPDRTSADFKNFMSSQSILRGFSTIVLLRGDGTVIQRSDINLASIVPHPTPETLAQVAASDDILVRFDARDGQTSLQATLRIRPGIDEYIFLVRPISPQISRYIEAARRGLVEYQDLQSRRFGLQIAIALMFTLVGLLVVLSSVYVGLAFANRLVSPVRLLIQASSLVADGRLDTSVDIPRSEGDLANLGDTFNAMTRELRSQRGDLEAARDQIDSRRRFIEAVLSGVTVGVIGLDGEGRVTLLNPTAAAILNQKPGALEGRLLKDRLPELASVLDEAAAARAGLVQREVELHHKGETRTLVVRVANETTEGDGPDQHGMVVTLDDITDLVSAQRTSAWADVARRIAHEIKNPLTPIQLSAERLKRKYGKVIVDDRDIFDQCTDTIIRQVGDIGRMVDEFSSFARMPKAQFAQDDAAETARQVVFLMRVGYPDLVFDARIPNGPMPGTFDRRLIAQALTNVIKNATEAIAARPDDATDAGRIEVNMAVSDGLATIDVIDNGIGLPKKNRARLLEPYVTSRAKGTGLGLAIVGKILEDHGGSLDLLDAPPGEGRSSGALVRLRFRLDMAAQPEPFNATDTAQPDIRAKGA